MSGARFALIQLPFTPGCRYAVEIEEQTLTRGVLQIEDCDKESFSLTLENQASTWTCEVLDRMIRVLIKNERGKPATLWPRKLQRWRPSPS